MKKCKKLFVYRDPKKKRDSIARYNLACVLALSGDAFAAFDSLERALASGYRNFDQLRTDPDLVKN